MHRLITGLLVSFGRRDEVPGKTFTHIHGYEKRKAFFTSDLDCFRVIAANGLSMQAKLIS